ncbi:MAG: hypothetical protein WC787_04600 [Patescibacteria group bacterium]|jgi:hypothetical protein
MRTRFPLSLFSRVIAFCGALAVFFCIGASSTHAFTVSPVLVDLDVSSGTSHQGVMTITNTDDQTRTYTVSTRKFVAKGEDGQQDFLPEEDQSGLASWIVPERRTVILEPGQTLPFSYSVVVPNGAEPGGHYAALFFSDRSEAIEASVGASAKIGVLFLVNVPGNSVEAANVEAFRSTSDRIDHLPARFELRVRNLGSAHVRLTGSVVIRNMLGATVARIPANPSGAAILPNSIRRLEPVWTKLFETKKEGFIAGLQNEWRNFGIGKYTANLEAIHGNAARPLTATTTFWVIPWRIPLAAVGIIFVLFVLMRLYNRAIVRTALRKRSRS